MKVAIVTVQVPFVRGGAEVLVETLRDELKKRGHEAEIVTIPFKSAPPEALANCMMMGRMMELPDFDTEKVDLVIAMKFPAYYIKHENKIIWLMHQHRDVYDLWGTDFCNLHLSKRGTEIRDFVVACDKQYLPEAKKIYTISENTGKRLKKYCKIDSEVLYHPPMNYEKLKCESYGDFVFYPSRVDIIKRQRLLVEAVKYTETEVKVIISGTGNKRECEYIQDFIRANHLENRVKLTGYISEEEKLNYYATCLGVYYGTYDEDYGYITLEAFYAKKPVMIHKDAGGPLEFVEDGVNGYVLENDVKEIAKKLDAWYSDRNLAKRQGEAGRQSLNEKNMDWDYVIDQLLES